MQKTYRAVLIGCSRMDGVPAGKQYADYREMIAAERPDIVSIATDIFWNNAARLFGVD